MPISEHGKILAKTGTIKVRGTVAKCFLILIAHGQEEVADLPGARCDGVMQSREAAAIDEARICSKETLKLGQVGDRNNEALLRIHNCHSLVCSCWEETIQSKGRRLRLVLIHETALITSRCDCHDEEWKREKEQNALRGKEKR